MRILHKALGLPGGDGRAILKILRKMAAEHTPFRLEIENTDVHFFTILDLRREMVVLSKPMGLRTKLKPGSMVRFSLPQHRNVALRLKVRVPNFQLMNGGPVFLCEIPTEYAEPPKRANDRYNTSRFKNLFLILPEAGKILRIVDVSAQGCKAYHGGAGEPDWVTLGEEIDTARIEVGNKVTLALYKVIPRSSSPRTLGFEFRVSETESGLKNFGHFLAALETAEKSRLKLHTP